MQRDKERLYPQPIIREFAMSDTAQKDASSSSGSAMMLRAWQVNAGKPGEKIVSLLPSFENTAGGEAAGAPEGG
ncbi:hypothetical protein FV219_19360, partial [Methylobacterium sp. WL122]